MQLAESTVAARVALLLVSSWATLSTSLCVDSSA